jgi:hypothetical protein
MQPAFSGDDCRKNEFLATERGHVCPNDARVPGPTGQDEHANQ